MNKIELQQAGGYPFDLSTLEFMQQAYTSLQSMAALGGDNYILSGCVTNGSNTSNGYVVLNGEVLPFEGGLTQSNIVILETKQKRPFENGQAKDVFFDRKATFGTSVGQVPFASLARVKDLQNLEKKIESYVPKGVIWLWSGSIATIPIGFGLCDGTAGKPDLRDIFVIGAGSSYDVDATGGSANAVVVAHSHSVVDGGHAHNLANDGRRAVDVGNYMGRLGTYDVDYNLDSNDYVSPPNKLLSSASTAGITIANSGESGTNKNLPPYYALAYIIKL